MHYTSRIPSLCLLLIAGCVFLLVPRADGNATSTTTTGSAGPASGGTTTSSSNATHFSGSSLLCAGLLGSGILGDVFTVAPLVTPRRGDPNTAIQFGKIWSDAHEATVEAPTSVKLPQSKPAVATVKLPISFSEIDRQKFTAAGWKPRKETGSHGISYCLDRAGRSDADSASQGMICVTAAL